MNYQAKNVLISGGSSGIGFALAKRFTQAGANVTILARRKPLLMSACADLEKFKVSDGQQIASISADVADFNALQKAFEKSEGVFDTLVNCAGVAYPGEFSKLDPEIFANVMQVNYFGTVYLTKLVVPGMIEKRSGYIVNISSLAALIGIF